MKYLFLVKIQDNPVMYEVFDIFQQFYNNDEQKKRWEDGFANNDVKIINTNSYEDISVGSIFDINTFTLILNEENQIFKIDKNRFNIALTSNNKVFALISYLKNSPEEEKYIAAMSQETLAIKYPESGIVNIGDLWNGINFINQENEI
jgi:hypothetical protein